MLTAGITEDTMRRKEAPTGRGEIKQGGEYNRKQVAYAKKCESP